VTVVPVAKAIKLVAEVHLEVIDGPNARPHSGDSLQAQSEWAREPDLIAKSYEHQQFLPPLDVTEVFP
jgi:hypothetical protein